MLPLGYGIEHSHDSCHSECKPVGSEHTDLALVSCSAGSSVGDSVGELVPFLEFRESCCSNSQTYMPF